MLQPRQTLLCLALSLLPLLTVSALDLKFLTHDWTSGPANLYSDLAKEIHRSQRVCDKKLWYSPPGAGMGSDIHVWSYALCNAMHRNMTLVQPGRTGGDWLWADTKFCKYNGSRVTNGRPFFNCYFNEGDTCKLSAAEEKSLVQNPQTRSLAFDYDFSGTCPRYVTDTASRQRFVVAAMEYLFSHLGEDLVAAADHAAGEVFHYKDVPRHKMISVHVRWGDKIREMQLVSVRTYMQALERLVEEQRIDTPFVYLTTETYEAYNEFKKVFSEDNKYANWTLLNHRRSLAGKGDYSGYKERNPLEFPQATRPNFPSRNVTGGSRRGSSSNSSDGESYSYSKSGSNSSSAGMQKVGGWRGKGLKRRQQQQQQRPDSPSLPEAPDAGGEGESSGSSGENKARHLASSLDINMNVLTSSINNKNNNKHSIKKHAFAKKEERLQLSDALGHAPPKGHVPQRPRHVQPNHPPRRKKQGGGYKITPAVRAVSPMALAKRGDQSLGRHSLIALLIAMEARHFVLTTGSNWSRLINELRLSKLEGQCRQRRESVGQSETHVCTTMVDLMQGDRADWRRRARRE